MFQIAATVQQFGVSVFHTVVRCHKIDKVENECILHNSVVLAISYAKNYRCW